MVDDAITVSRCDGAVVTETLPTDFTFVSSSPRTQPGDGRTLTISFQSRASVVLTRTAPTGVAPTR